MKIKLKTQSLDDWELNLFESYSTLPIIIGRTMIFGAYNVDFEMTANIWNQLPEEYKRKIYKYNWKKMIKSMLITVTDITAYSFGFGYNIKLKDSITMEEISKNFDENKKINFLTPSCAFPNSSMSVYFQYLGEVYAEVDLDELVAISDEENSFQYSIMPKLMEASNYRKRRENNTGKLEQIYNEQLIVKNIVNKNIDELSKEETQKVLDNFLLIDVLERDLKNELLKETLKECEQRAAIVIEEPDLGKFILDKNLKAFLSKIEWINPKKQIDISLNIGENTRIKALEKVGAFFITLEKLVNNKKEWDKKLKIYAAENLVDLANELRKNLKGMFKFIKIWKWRFIQRIKLIRLEINSNGEFVATFDDGKLFVGHKIAVNGNVNGELINSAIVENFNIEDYKKVELALSVNDEKNEDVSNEAPTIDSDINDKDNTEK